MTSFYSLSATKGDGSTLNMSDCQGKVVYATNSLGETYGDKLVILAFPSQEFGGQEYGDDAKIAEFAAKKEFPGILMKLGNILGSNAPEVWKFFKAETGARDPTWNFKGKFLVSKDGKVSVPTNVEADIASLM